MGRGQGGGAAPRGRQHLRRRPLHDIEGALAADALSVSVLTGGCTREELFAAGTHVVLDSLTEFPDWLDEHLLTTRLAALEADLRARVRCWWPTAGERTARSCSRPPSARSVRTGSSPRPATRTRCPRSSATRRARSPSPSASRSSRRRRTRWTARATAPTVRTAASSARPSSSRCSPTRGAARARRCRDRHQRRRRGGRLPPGIRAADERGAVAPLRDAGLTKAQVREASHRWGLPTWDKPAAACLSSRVAYGVEVTARPGPRGAGRGRRTP